MKIIHNPHTYLSSLGYYKKKILLVYFYLHRILYRVETKGCVYQTNLKGELIEPFEVDFYSLMHGKKTAFYKKCERYSCDNGVLNAPHHHFCSDCMINQAIFLTPLVNFMNK